MDVVILVWLWYCSKDEFNYELHNRRTYKKKIIENILGLPCFTIKGMLIRNIRGLALIAAN